ncbi:MAG: glycosyltransferase family 4 protein [Deltaproteobacteria bacterium]|nr:glycosyltransferase family 4 protein [Deltaproteobacteria bacterium]
MPGRVCMVVHEYFPRDFRVRREARALVAAGYEIDIICLKQPGQASKELFEGMNVFRLPIMRHRGSALPVYMAEYMAFAGLAAGLVTAAHINRPYDVVHVHAPPDFLVTAGVLTRLLSARLILDIHDLTPELYGSRFKKTGGAAAQMIMQFIERGSCAAADKVITVTEAFKQLLVERGVSPEKVVVLHNCPDPEAFSSKPIKSKTGQEFVIIHHGTLVHRYGVDILLKAFEKVAAELPQARLQIYGEGDWLPRLESRVAQNGLAGRVSLFGEVAQGRVAQALADADLCVVPNRQDDFTDLLLPTKLLEALQMGCPTIASATRVIAETFPSGVCLVKPGDVDALAQAISRLAENNDERDNLAAAGKLQAKRFEWTTEKHKLLDLYRD